MYLGSFVNLLSWVNFCLWTNRKQRKSRQRNSIVNVPCREINKYRIFCRDNFTLKSESEHENGVTNEQCTWWCEMEDKFTNQWWLPPANEVWGKVMFLHVSVILLPGGLASQHASQVKWPASKGGCFPACITGHMTRGFCIQGEGLCIWGVLHPRRGRWSAYMGVCIQGEGGLLRGGGGGLHPWGGGLPKGGILLECVLVDNNFYSPSTLSSRFYHFDLRMTKRKQNKNSCQQVPSPGIKMGFKLSPSPTRLPLLHQQLSFSNTK